MAIIQDAGGSVIDYFQNVGSQISSNVESFISDPIGSAKESVEKQTTQAAVTPLGAVGSIGKLAAGGIGLGAGAIAGYFLGGGQDQEQTTVVQPKPEVTQTPEVSPEQDQDADQMTKTGDTEQTTNTSYDYSSKNIVLGSKDVGINTEMTGETAPSTQTQQIPTVTQREIVQVPVVSYLPINTETGQSATQKQDQTGLIIMAAAALGGAYLLSRGR